MNGLIRVFLVYVVDTRTVGIDLNVWRKSLLIQRDHVTKDQNQRVDGERNVVTRYKIKIVHIQQQLFPSSVFCFVMMDGLTG